MAPYLSLTVPSSSISTTPIVHLDNTLGAVLIGVIVAAALWGVSCAQVMFYYKTFPRDRMLIKSLVAAVWISDTLHQILISHTVYVYLVTFYGDFNAIGKIVWSIIIEVLVNGITAFLVQCFLVMRVFVLCKGHGLGPLLGYVASALVLGELLAVLVYIIQLYALGITTFVELEAIRGASMAINIFGVASDLFLSVTLCFLLHRSRSGIKRTDTMINVLILFTMNTGLLTSICAVASLVSILAAPTTFIYIAFFFNLGRMYSNTLLVVLNARDSIRKIGVPSEAVALSPLQTNGTGKTARSAHTGKLAIHFASHDQTSDSELYWSGSKDSEDGSRNDSGHESKS